LDWKQLLFSFDGRANRAKYWLVSLLSVAVMVVAVTVFFGLFPASIAWVVLAAIVMLCIYVGVAVSSKRLHDRNKSASWLLLYYLVPGVFNGLAQDSYEGMNLVLNLIGHGISLWALIDLGFLRGTPGDNQYGSDPLATV
jgi:uncharacterized membrane protein YhaH (DUF805 family)